MPDLSIRTPQLVTCRGAILLQRLGPLTTGEQSRWSTAPESKGMWAFPYPFYDGFFTYHKYEDLMPKSLQFHHRSSIPKDPKWVYSNDPDFQPDITASFLADLAKKFAARKEAEFSGQVIPDWLTGRVIPDWFCVNGELYDARSAWVKDVGRKILPIRKFWYSGEIYSHLRPNGEPGVEDEWHKIDTEFFVRRFRKSGGTVVRVQDFLLRTSIDHLELFIPRNAGRISGTFA